MRVFICASSKSKYLLLLAASIFVASSGAYADKLDWYGILRKDDGSIQIMNQYEAMKACPRGTHLSTVRELAELGRANGAKRIWEPSYEDVPGGYHEYSVINLYVNRSFSDPEGARDRFYYNPQGYNYPSYIPDLGNIWLWSSSSHFDYNSPYAHQAYGLSGADGEIFAVYRYLRVGAVRCVVGPYAHAPSND